MACGSSAPAALDGLRSPRGLTALDDGSLLIAEVAGGRILRWTPGEPSAAVVLEQLPATEVGPEGAPAGVSAALLQGSDIYFIVGEARAKGFRELYQAAPGQVPLGMTGQDILATSPPNRITNPYDLIPAPGGGFFVSDSGRNAVWHIAADGTIADYALFAPIDTEPADGAAATDAVPTGLALGPDGALYVATLTGFPFPAGAASVYRLSDDNGDGDALDDGEVAVYATGFTAATDVAFDGDGALLVTEFSLDMARLAEIGFARAEEAPGRLVRWREGTMEVLADDLVSPTALTVLGGRIFVSEEFAGRVVEVR